MWLARYGAEPPTGNALTNIPDEFHCHRPGSPLTNVPDYAVRELLEQLPDALRQSWPARSLRGLQRELSVEVNAGVLKVTGKLVAPPTEQRDFVMPLQRALRPVGERAEKRGSGLLLTIDEQTVPLDALADLGMIIQTSRLPCMQP